MSASHDILERFRLAHGKDIDLGLRSPYTDLLARFDNPEKRLPPTFLVAGTNGKGSTCAFLRAMLEAAGKTVHVYTSPHLLTFHERIRIAGELITEEKLYALLTEIEKVAEPGGLSLFEAQTAAALISFANQPADICILEVGLGGRLDATNVVPTPIASIIARLSFDHREYLGNTMADIAREKAGILRPKTLCFSSPQPSAEALSTLRHEASNLSAPLYVGQQEWTVETTSETAFRFRSACRTIEKVPNPALVGEHQIWNAGLAIASLAALPFTVPDDAIRQGMLNVEWNGRLQHLTNGKLVDLLGTEHELWIDGGHNDSAGEVLAAQMEKWQAQDNKPLYVIFGMLSSKVPEECVAPFCQHVQAIRTVSIPNEALAFSAESLCDKLSKLGKKDIKAASSIEDALQSLRKKATKPSRVLICGSLYLAGRALSINQEI